MNATDVVTDNRTCTDLFTTLPVCGQQDREHLMCIRNDILQMKML